MTRIPLHPPLISPVSSEAYRPLWSVMIPAYNCAGYLKEALQSVLQQDPGEDLMQIQVVDDCSTDADISQLVQDVGKGRVEYFRQSQNVGSVRNFETCLNHSRGRVIHLLHADDKVKPGFYAKMAGLLQRFPEAGAAFCNYEFINGEGNWLYANHREHEQDTLLTDQLLKMAEQCKVQYVSIVVKREVYEKEGGFFGVIYGEDWEMWARIAKDYAFAYTPEILAEYRVHDSNISANSFRTGDNIRDISRVIDQIGTYLPAKVREQITRKARRHYARYLLSTSEFIWHVSRDKKTVFGQVAGALKLHKDAFMMAKAAKIYAKVWLHPFRKMIGNVKD